MPRSLSGSRIREARRRLGLTQAGLAKGVGISPSYLNLIEHNRRRIGGALLNALAEALEIRATELSDGGNPTIVPDLHAALAEHPVATADPRTAEALAGRFPDWARLILLQNQRIRDQQAVIAALSDRLAHDPFLSENVHAMLSHITAIRSTAGILSTVPDVPSDQLARFYEGMVTESERLSTTAQALADYLGAAAGVTETAATPEEVLDHYLLGHGYHFDALDQPANPAQTPDQTIESLLAEDPNLAPETPARALVHAHLRQYAQDAAAMPLDAFVAVARQVSFDPTVLAQHFDQSITAVFRRLASLHRPGLDVPRFGLIVVTVAGYPLLRQPLPSFPLPRHGNACALWPLFRGFAQPGTPMLNPITHDSGEAFVTLTYAASRQSPRFGVAPDLAASMLFVAQAQSPFTVPHAAASPVGTSCRICTRSDCAARAQAQLVL